VWTIPVGHWGRKTREELVVPLSTAAIALLRGLERKSEYLFKGARWRNAPISEPIYARFLRSLGNYTDPKILDENGNPKPITAHGFRSTCDTWAHETTRHSFRVIEMSLGHKVKGQIEGAYNRGDLLNQRRALMQDWANFWIGFTGRPRSCRSGGRLSPNVPSTAT
jgi:integrase